MSTVSDPVMEVVCDPPVPFKLTSTSIHRIAPALSKAQAAVKEVTRNQTGFMPTKSGGYEYKYAGLDEVHNATRDAQVQNGLSLFTPFEMDLTGVRSLRVFLMHESGEWLNYGLYPLGSFSTHQNLGSAVTYARRYLEGVIYKVSPQDDDDARSATEEQKRRQLKADAQRGEYGDDGAPPQRSNQRARQPAKGPSKTQQPLIPEFKLPPKWPHTGQEELLAWVGELKPAGHFQAALGMFMNDPEVYGDLKRWGEVCRQLNTTYHMRLQGTDEKRRASLDSITKALDGALNKVELDEQAEAAFNKAPVESSEQGQQK